MLYSTAVERGDAVVVKLLLLLHFCPNKTVMVLGFEPGVPLKLTVVLVWTLPVAAVWLAVPPIVTELPETLEPVADGVAPSLLDANSPTAAVIADASFLIDVLREFRCRAGTANSTINSINAAMASTIMTSIIVKPSLRDFLILLSIAGAPLQLNISAYG